MSHFYKSVLNLVNMVALMTTIFKNTSLVAMAGLLYGCAEVSTQNAPVAEAQPGAARTGLHYFLPRGIISIEGVQGSDDKSFTITIARQNEADRERRYLLVQHGSAFHEDATTFTVAETGLLNEAVNVSSASKTGAIINNLTDTAINVATIVARANGIPAPGNNLQSLSSAVAEAILPFKPFKVSFDPFRPGEVRHAVRALSEAGFRLSVETPKLPDRSHLPEESLVQGTLDRGGVFYRPLTTVRVNISGNDKVAIDLHQNVPVPDLNALAVFNLRRGFLITKTTNLTFANGEPRVMTHSKPSELLAATQIPLDVTTKLVAALPSIGDFLFPRQVSASSKLTAETARLKAEQDLSAQQLATMQAKQAFEDARKGRGTTPGGGGTESKAATAAMLNASVAAQQIRKEAATEATVKTQAAGTAHAKEQQTDSSLLDLQLRLKALEEKASH